MATCDLPRPQIIEILMAQHPEKDVDAAIHVWEQMATQIISIVGENSFNSLYARSLFLSQAKFPWLATGSLTENAVHRFKGLKTCLEGHTPLQANEANTLLLITFIEILVALIGVQLTSHILRLVWGIDASNSAGKGSVTAP
jgi:hypothetical protein